MEKDETAPASPWGPCERQGQREPPGPCSWHFPAPPQGSLWHPGSQRFPGEASCARARCVLGAFSLPLGVASPCPHFFTCPWRADSSLPLS